MGFDAAGRLGDYGIPAAELDEVIASGTAFRTSGCPGREGEDVSACDRPYGDSPPRDIASYPFRLNRRDVARVRIQIASGTE